MQVLNMTLTFGENESYISERNLEIRIPEKYPLKFSLLNASYKIISFEKESVAKLKLSSIYYKYNKDSLTSEYTADLYLKFPLNTFTKSDKIIDLTFDEYNKATNNYDIDFTSLVKITEDEEKNYNFIKYAIIILAVVIFLRLTFFLFQAFKEELRKEVSILIDEWENLIERQTKIEEDYPEEYIIYESDRANNIKNQILRQNPRNKSGVCQRSGKALGRGPFMLFSY